MNNTEKSDRLINTAAALLLAARNQELNIVILNKCIFYLDLVALRDNGKAITENTFIALENGPVVAKYDKRLVRELDRREVATEVDDWSGRKPLKLIEPQSLPSYLQGFKKEIQRIANYFSSSRDASEFSHQNLGWKLAWDARKEQGGRPVPINMLIAMQQVLQDDPWLHEPLSEKERHDIIGPADSNSSEDW